MFRSDLLTEREIEILRFFSQDAKTVGFNQIFLSISSGEARRDLAQELFSEICSLRMTNEHLVHFVVPRLIKLHKLLAEAQASLDPTANVSLIRDIQCALKEVPVDHHRESEHNLLTKIVEQNEAILRGQHAMATTLANLQAADQALADAINQAISEQQAAIADIQDLAAKVAGLGSNSLDPAAVQAVADDLTAKAAALKASTDALASVVAPAPATDASTSTSDTSSTSTDSPAVVDESIGTQQQ